MAVRGSLRRDQRKHVSAAYKARGRGNNDLSVFYSPKTDRDWILPSSRQLIHWVHFLEINPLVKTFDLTPEPVFAHDGKEQRATELDARVVFHDDSIEWHEVKSGTNLSEQDKAQLVAQSAFSAERGEKYRIFTDTDLKPHVITSVRWLKVIALAAAVRDQPNLPITRAIHTVLESLGSGTIRQLLSQLDEFGDPGATLGVVSRIAIQGHIDLDLTARSFGYKTPWYWKGN